MNKDLTKALISTAEDAGARDVRIVHGGKHPKLCGRIRASKFKFAFPKTPSDWRSHKNCISALKRHIARSGLRTA